MIIQSPDAVVSPMADIEDSVRGSASASAATC